jgi:DNA-binding transcriptional regulator LsrR (DeoR family)
MRDKNHRELLCRIAELSYLRNLTNVKIARQFDLSEARIGQLLQEARDRGIVRIEIAWRLTQWEQQLRNMFPCLKEAIVIPSESENPVLRAKLGSTVARYFDEHVKSGCKVGLGGGTTLLRMVEELETADRNISIFPTVIARRSSRIVHFDPYELASLLLSKSNWNVAQAYGLILPPAKEKLEDDIIKAAKQLEKEKREVLKNNEDAFSLYQEMKEVDYAFVCSGPIDNPYSQESTVKALSARGLKRETLKKAGVIGHIDGLFLCKDEPYEISPHITLTRKELAIMSKNPNKTVVLVSGGAFNARCLKLILEKKLCNVFITDKSTVMAIEEAKI